MVFVIHQRIDEWIFIYLSVSCNDGLFGEPEGHLASPGYPNPEYQTVTCQYIISVPAGFTVSLNFSENFQIESIDTEQGPVCPHHWLQVRSHAPYETQGWLFSALYLQVTIPGQETARLCGVKSPGLMVTNSSTVTLDYYTDSDGWSKGWSLDYSTHSERPMSSGNGEGRWKTHWAIESSGIWLMLQCLLCISGVQCPFPGTLGNGRVTPTLSQYLYHDYIFVRCDTGYKLMMVSWKSPFGSHSHRDANIALIFPVIRFFLIGWGRATELLCYVPKQWALAPPSARVPQYDILNFRISFRSKVLLAQVLPHQSAIVLPQ